MRLYTSHFVTLFVMIVCAVLSACERADEVHRNGDLGSVEMALVTTGTDGAAYRLTPGTELFLGNATTSVSKSLDGDEAFVSVSMPPGDYDAELSHPNGYTTEWPLERRVGDEPVEIVTATLVSPNPSPVTVATNQSTDLVLAFTVPTGGTVVFERGNVNVSVSVGGSSALGFNPFFDATFEVADAFFDGPFASTLTERLPNIGQTGLQIAITGRLSGDWQEAGGSEESVFSICAPLEVLDKAFGGHSGFNDFVSEVGFGDASVFLFGPANFCVRDDGFGADSVRFRVSRIGVPTTATFSDLTTSELLFSHVFIGQLPEEVYDYNTGTLDLDALMRATALPLTGNSRVEEVVDGVPTGLDWYFASYSGAMTTFSFAP